MAKPETITSAANPLVKDVRKAIARGTLTEDGLCVAETFHLLEEALRSDCEVRYVLASETVRSAVETHVRGVVGVKVAVLPDALFASIAGTETSQGVMALVKPAEWKLAQLFRGSPLVVVLDGMQDPGNAGTIARAAEAFGATGIIFLKGSVSPYNAKTLRASAGSLFRVPFVHGVDAVKARAELAQNKVELFAGVPANSKKPAKALTFVDFTGRCGLVIGSEAHGVSPVMRAAALEVSIPTVGVESLNAGIAAGILLYEARRQRMMKT
jgi:TrmH family RNA methyltransferase